MSEITLGADCRAASFEKREDSPVVYFCHIDISMDPKCTQKSLATDWAAPSKDETWVNSGKDTNET